MMVFIITPYKLLPLHGIRAPTILLVLGLAIQRI